MASQASESAAKQIPHLPSPIAILLCYPVIAILSTWRTLQSKAIPLVLFLLFNISWLQIVWDKVPEPYLDEVFHVRQAQAYCHNNFSIWDNKITTPPGLYLFAYLQRLLFVNNYEYCDQVWFFRATSIFFHMLIIKYTLEILEPHIRLGAEHTESCREDSVIQALNIGFFPLIKFFSAFFYTDVGSTAMVLIQYKHFLAYKEEGFDSMRLGITQVIIGTAAILFRQTNIFWVAFFPAALVVVGIATDVSGQTTNQTPAPSSIKQAAERAWNSRQIYDPLVAIASIEDYARMAVSVVLVALSSFKKLLRALAPYLALMTGFGAFILWNGGVVLGDKSNHIATIHLAQMLYVWPFITFFSFPVMIPSLLRVFRSVSTGTNSATPRLSILATALGLATVIVYYNTIVHPFILADNRHFVFYVFKILRTYELIKYAAVPVYVVLGWAVINSLGGVETVDSNPERANEDYDLDDGGPQCASKVSFAFVWLATTTLSVATAPLVEPRYFIIPWLFWRLHTPIPADRKSKDSAASPWLHFETAWLFVVNQATQHMFLNWPFEWPEEPGVLQRFMW